MNVLVALVLLCGSLAQAQDANNVAEVGIGLVRVVSDKAIDRGYDVLSASVCTSDQILGKVNDVNTRVSNLYNTFFNLPNQDEEEVDYSEQGLLCESGHLADMLEGATSKIQALNKNQTGGDITDAATTPSTPAEETCDNRLPEFVMPTGFFNRGLTDDIANCLVQTLVAPPEELVVFSVEPKFDTCDAQFSSGYIKIINPNDGTILMPKSCEENVGKYVSAEIVQVHVFNRESRLRSVALTMFTINREAAAGKTVCFEDIVPGTNQFESPQSGCEVVGATGALKSNLYAQKMFKDSMIEGVKVLLTDFESSPNCDRDYIQMVDQFGQPLSDKFCDNGVEKVLDFLEDEYRMIISTSDSQNPSARYRVSAFRNGPP